MDARDRGDPERRPRSPSWLRALLISLAVVAAGFLLGAAWYKLERAASAQPPTVTRTADGWRITARQQREFSGLGLSETRLLWQNGAAIEYLDLASGRLRLLGPGPGKRTTWDPAIGDRYAVWFEAERTESLAASAVAYDTLTGRRWTFAEVGSVRSYPAISGDVAVWCSAAALGSPTINGARVGSGEAFEVAPGDGAPVVSGGLVVWAASWTGPFYAHDLTGGASRPVVASLTNGRLTGLSLSGRTLVWGQSPPDSGSAGGIVAAVDVDGGGTTTLASGVSGLSGPAFDGRTVVWGERTADGDRVMGRRLGGGPAFVIAAADGAVREVAVSGGTVAWIASPGASGDELIVTRLPR
jgi:hypothetical protein